MQFSVSLQLHLKIWLHYLTKNFYAQRRWLVKMRPMWVLNDHNSFSNLSPTCSQKFWQKLPLCRQSGYPGCRQWAGPWPALRPRCNPSKRPPLSEAPGQEFGPPGLVSFVTTWNRQKGPESCRCSKQSVWPTVWPDGWIIGLIFGHLHQWKFAQHQKLLKWCTILKDTIKKFRQIWSHWWPSKFDHLHQIQFAK